jgi:CheY-like chemotaxis protein
MSSIRPAAEAKEIRLQVVIDAQVPAVNGDPGRLQQVFWNLLTNAVKFTPKAGLVAVTLARVKSHVEVRVMDDGAGIDPTFLPHVFDRFRQADASSTRRYGGLGLGLSIVKQLVELHGGGISVESEGVGRGATFRVMLPPTATSLHPRVSEPRREHSDPGSESGTGIDMARPDLHGANVLVVDDDMDARALVRRLLTDCNAVVRMAGSAAEALEQIQLATPDVLISDIGMPGEDGYSLIQRIRAMKGLKAHIPAVALTAYARAEDRVKVLQAGYERHLAKPVEPSGLLKIVVSLIERSDEEVK